MRLSGVTLAPTEKGPHRVLSIITMGVRPKKRNRIIRSVVLKNHRNRSAAESEPNIIVDDILAQCVRDSFPPIRAEATYRRAECIRRIAKQRLNKEQLRAGPARLKAERTQVESLRPKVTFNQLASSFWHSHDQPDYTTTDIFAYLNSIGIC